MVDWLSNWAGAIIIAVIIATIIEMILPEGNCKKYIKVVIGVYILFTIISPVMTKFTGKTLAVSDLLELDQYIDEVKEREISQNILLEENSTSIREIYIGNLKADIQNKLKGKGYTVTSIALSVGNDKNYTLEQISLSAIKDEENEEEYNDSNEKTNDVTIVSEINILVSDTTKSYTNEEIGEKVENNLSNSDKKNIKEYLSSVYEINEKNIVIK